MIVERVRVPEALVPDRDQWPFTVPVVRSLIGEGLALDRAVTFVVGENGSGKSTVVEALAEAWGVDVRAVAAIRAGRRRSIDPRSGA